MDANQAAVKRRGPYSVSPGVWQLLQVLWVQQLVQMLRGLTALMPQTRRAAAPHLMIPTLRKTLTSSGISSITHTKETSHFMTL